MTAASRDDTGDWLGLGASVHAATDLLDDAWWTPTAVAPGQDLPCVPVTEKGMPHSAIVDQQGRRFVNEAAPYVTVRGMQRAGAAPAFLVLDRRYRRRYPIGRVLPGLVQPDFLLSHRGMGGAG